MQFDQLKRREFITLGGVTAAWPLAARAQVGRGADIVNVKDFGAVGNGVKDDRRAIQAAFDAAFGPASAPHGEAGKYNNRPVWFPNGNYAVSGTVTLTRVSGGLIFGSVGSALTYIGSSPNNKALLAINGMVDTRIEKLGFVHSRYGANTTAVDLDWDGTGDVALNNNVIFQCGAVNAIIGFRVANSGNDGANNKFIASGVGSGRGVGIQVLGANATGQVLIGGSGASSTPIGVQVRGGSISSIIGVSFATNSTFDIKIDNASTCVIEGGRSESTNFLSVAAGAKVLVAGVHHTISGTTVSMTDPAAVILDAVGAQYIMGTGSLYMRGCTGDISRFTGTLVQHI